MATYKPTKLYPVACITCGKRFFNMGDYERLIESGMPVGEAMEKLGYRRECCRDELMSTGYHPNPYLERRSGYKKEITPEAKQPQPAEEFAKAVKTGPIHKPKELERQAAKVVRKPAQPMIKTEEKSEIIEPPKETIIQQSPRVKTRIRTKPLVLPETEQKELATRAKQEYESEEKTRKGLAQLTISHPEVAKEEMKILEKPVEVTLSKVKTPVVKPELATLTEEKTPPTPTGKVSIRIGPRRRTFV